jgi:ABC-type multidrug transport system ATPase subunit
MLSHLGGQVSMVDDSSVQVPAISVHDVTKSFGDRAVLKGASIEVASGEGAVLQGPNGVGKTTLLRILVTVMTPDGGWASVGGFDVRRQAARVRQRIGVAFVNERSIYWRLNAWENLMLFAATRGVDKSQREAQIRSIAEELDVTPFLTRRIADLSTGQRQRIILARAGLGDPQVLLIDEPLRGLDEDGVERALAFLKARTDAGAAALIVSPTIKELGGRNLSLFRLRDGVIRPDEWDN